MLLKNGTARNLAAFEFGSVIGKHSPKLFELPRRPKHRFFPSLSRQIN